jgi:hypothetical protein
MGESLEGDKVSVRCIRKNVCDKVLQFLQRSFGRNNLFERSFDPIDDLANWFSLL